MNVARLGSNVVMFDTCGFETLVELTGLSDIGATECTVGAFESNDGSFNEGSL